MEERRHHQRRDRLTEADRRRVEDVFTTHRRYIEGVARQHAFDQDAVPDIVQSVGVQVCRGLNGFRGDSELRTWLYRVTVNVARDAYRMEARHQRAREAVKAGFIDRVIDPDQEAIGSARLNALRGAIDRLKPLHQRTIREHLSDQAGQGEVQTDQKRQTSETTLKHRRLKARVSLRAMLRDDPRFQE